MRLANLLITVGMVAVTCINVGWSWFSFEVMIKESELMASDIGYVGPLAAFTLITVVTVIIFHGVFDEIVLQMTICFAIDLDLHGGKEEYGPPDFHKKIEAIYGAEGKYGHRSDGY